MAISREQQIINQFGKKVRAVREAKGYSLQGLADAAEMAKSNLHDIEQGLVNPKASTIVLLAEALGVDPGELFPR